MSALTADNIYKLDRGDIYKMVRQRDAIDHKKRVPLEAKCRTHCVDNVPGWNRRILEVDNAIIRAIRKDGAFDSRDFMAAMAALEEAALAELCVDILDDAEYSLLARPAMTACEAVAEAPEAKNIWTAPVGIAELPETGDEDLFGFSDAQADPEPPRALQGAELDALLESLEEPISSEPQDVNLAVDEATGAYVVRHEDVYPEPPVDTGKDAAETDPYEDWL